MSAMTPMASHINDSIIPLRNAHRPVVVAVPLDWTARVRATIAFFFIERATRVVCRAPDEGEGIQGRLVVPGATRRLSRCLRPHDEQGVSVFAIFACCCSSMQEKSIVLPTVAVMGHLHCLLCRLECMC